MKNHKAKKGQAYIDRKHNIGHANNIYQWTLQRMLGLRENPPFGPRSDDPEDLENRIGNTGVQRYYFENDVETYVIIYYGWIDGEEDVWYIRNFDTEPDSERRKGFGRMGYEQFENYAKDNGVRELILIIVSEPSFWSKMGFKRTHRKYLFDRGYYPLWHKIL